MASTSGVMLRVLLNRTHKTPTDAPIQYLPQEIARTLASINIQSNDPAQALIPPSEQLQAIHYSWLLPAFQQFPQALHPVILKALPQSFDAKLRPLLKIGSQAHFELAPLIRNLLLNKLFLQVKPQGILPLPYIPESPLSFLAQLNKQQLVEIIDFLGIYDLAEGIRHIIDKTFLQKLYACLSHKHKQFLRICLHQQEKISTARMEMSTWTGDCKKLSLMLQRRGLLRLGKSLCGLHPDFVWHVAHRLDSGRGNILLKYYTEEPSPGITSRLVQQVIALMNFLTPKRTP